MNKKGKKQLIFTNDDYHNSKAETPPKPIKTIVVKQTSCKIRNFNFNYSFKQYLRLALAKLILRDNFEITFIPEKSVIIGQQEKCRNLINKVLDELSRYKFVLVTFVSAHDLDQIEYWLEEGATIYRPGVVEVALRQLQKKQLFLEDCQKFRNKINASRVILLRVQRDREESIIKMINKITDEANYSKKQQNSTQFYTSTKEGQTNNENTFLSGLESQISIINGQKGASSSCEMQDENSGEGSSYSFSENDSSIMRQSFNIYAQVKKGQKMLQQIQPNDQ